jgi:hypothetical protein
MERLVEAGEHHQQNAVVKSCSRPLTDLKWGMVYKTHFCFSESFGYGFYYV